MEPLNNQEIYEAKDDAVDNFDTLNEVYRNTWDWIVNTSRLTLYFKIIIIERRSYRKN